MKKIAEILASLVRPFVGFVSWLFTGRFGWRRLLEVVKQFGFQAAFIGLFMGTATRVTLEAATILTIIHVACSFILFMMLVGSSFPTNSDRADTSTIAGKMLRTALWVVALPTLIVLGVLGFFHASTIFGAVSTFVFSIGAGAAIDVTAVLDAFESASRSSETAPAEEPAVTAPAAEPTVVTPVAPESKDDPAASPPR